MLGRGMADDGHRPGLVPARDSPGTTGFDQDSCRHGTRLTPTGTPHDGRSDSSGTTGIPHNGRADSSGTTGTPHDGLSDSSGTTGIPHNGRADSSGPCPAWASWIAGFPAHRYPCVGIGARWFVSGMGVMDRRFSRASIPMSGDRCALVRVRHGRHGSPVFPRIDTHAWGSVCAGSCPAWASWIAGFPAHRYPCVGIGAR